MPPAPWAWGLCCTGLYMQASSRSVLAAQGVAAAVASCIGGGTGQWVPGRLPKVVALLLYLHLLTHHA